MVVLLNPTPLEQRFWLPNEPDFLWGPVADDVAAGTDTIGAPVRLFSHGALGLSNMMGLMTESLSRKFFFYKLYRSRIRLVSVEDPAVFLDEFQE